ncbi:MAG TPA: glycosyltransferase [Solirubrobacteraceae bacterium]|jgi:glycosyltransferase involved in cell wall biosynthesis|nr:glycosyltransferase [Solirubrobacteraceae bacterium]
MSRDIFAIVTAHNEADRIAATLAALARAFPGAPVFVGDDGSTDGTAAIATVAGARVVRSERTIGKGGAATLAARAALGALEDDDASVALLCDGDLGDSAERLRALVDCVLDGEADLAVAVFSKRVGGGLGLAVGFAGWAIRRRCGLAPRAPISGQRALRASLLGEVLPFAHGFGMEVGMTIDATRVRARVQEVDLDLSHRATGRTLGGFVHRGRQLLDFVRAYAARR